MKRFIFTERRKFTWHDIAAAAIVLAVLLILVSGCAPTEARVAGRDALSCDLHVTIPQGSARIPLRVVHAMPDCGSTPVVDPQPTGNDETRGRGVRDTDVR